MNVDSTLQAFQDALLVERVVERHKEALVAPEAIDQAARAAKNIGELLQHMIDEAHSGADRDYVQPIGEQLPRVLGQYKHFVDQMSKAIDTIPKGKEQQRAKTITKELAKVFSKGVAEYKWEGSRWLTPSTTERALKKLVPLVDELDKLLAGQKVLFKSANYSKEQMDFFRSSQRTEKAVKAMYRLKEQLGRIHHEPEKERTLYQKVYDLAEGLHDEGIRVHKMIQRYKGKNADFEFKTLAKSLQELEHELREGGDSSMPAFTSGKLVEAAEKVHGDVHRAGALALAGGLGAA